MTDHPGNRFGEVAVREGFATRAQVRDCLEIQAKLKDYGVEPKKLGEIMLEKGFLTERDVEAILEVQKLGQSQSRVEQRSGQSRVARVSEDIVLRKSSADRPQGDALPPLKEIPGYDILELIGQGGMGAVYKAKQKSLDRIVALKILPPRAAKDEQFIKKFISEARTVARLNHENIIAGIDVGEANGTYYFAMEHVDGETLAKLVDKDGPLDEERALRITLQIARALEHAHKHGLVHRDVKPQNVLVSERRSAEDGETSDLAKLCDLGLAKSLDERKSSADREREGLPLGTPHYLSPEQARGEADVDIRSDIYSLGATLYHALTGRTPFDGQSPMVLMTKHLTEDPTPPRKRNPDVSKAASDLVLKMMAKQKEDRHQTPTELIEDLERALEGRRGGEKRRGAVSGAGRGTTTGKRKRTREEEESSDAAERRRAARTRAAPTQGGSGTIVAVIFSIVLVAAGIWFVTQGAGTAPTMQEEEAAARELNRAKSYVPQATTDEDRASVRKALDRIVEKYPETQAAAEARRLRDSLR